MNSRAPFSALFFLLLVAACGKTGGETGGTCEYTQLEVVGTVQQVSNEKATVSLPGIGDAHVIDEVRFPEPPKPGQRYQFIVQTIAKGSCTPYAYRVMKRLP